MAFDHKSMAAEIVGKLVPDKKAEEPETDALDAAAEDILAAIQSKDATGLKAALSAFVGMADEDEPAEGEE